MAGRWSGMYRGMVMNSTDPYKSGRVQVKVPVIGDISNWAMVCRPLGMSLNTGAAPVVGSGVWVMFEDGDAAKPVVVGAI